MTIYLMHPDTYAIHGEAIIKMGGIVKLDPNCPKDCISALRDEDDDE